MIRPDYHADEAKLAMAFASHAQTRNPVSPGIVSDSAPEVWNRRKQRPHPVFREPGCRTFPSCLQGYCLPGNNLDLMKNKSYGLSGQYLFLESIPGKNPIIRITNSSWKATFHKSLSSLDYHDFMSN